MSSVSPELNINASLELERRIYEAYLVSTSEEFIVAEQTTNSNSTFLNKQRFQLINRLERSTNAFIPQCLQFPRT